MKTLLALFLLFIASCGGDVVHSGEPIKAVCSRYQDCWAYGETPEGCCIDPHNPYAWICVDFQSNQFHCGGCDITCPLVCSAGICQP